jgi:hypothetical protein
LLIINHGVQQNSTWPLGGNQISGLSYANPPNQPPLASIPKGWQNGDWLCNRGFHNYSSRRASIIIIIIIIIIL